MKMTVDQLRHAVKEAAECDSCKNPTAHLDNTKHFHDVKLLVESIDALETQRDGYRVGYDSFKARCFRLENELKSSEDKAEMWRSTAHSRSGLATRLQAATEALKFLINVSPHDGDNSACLYCDMGGAGYSSKGENHHDDKPPRDICPVVVAMRALNEQG